MNGSPFSHGRLKGAVKWLILFSLPLFVFQQIFTGRIEPILGLVPAKVLWQFCFWQPFTYLFLHGGFFHIFINLFTLWMFGKELEYAWGTKEFLKFYFICGLGAAFFNTVLEPFSNIPIIGASGAIYGLLVAFSVVFPDSVIYLYGIIPMRGKHFVILIGVVEFMASFHGTHSGIARLAHLGGMLTGYLYLKSYEFRSFLNRASRRVMGLFVVREDTTRKNKNVGQETLIKEVDRILEKVLLHGAESLTEEEREIMRRYSSMKH